MTRRLGHILLAVVGLVIATVSLTLALTQTPVCRGVPMQPGEVCRTTDGKRQQPYDEALSSIRIGTGIFVVVGLGVAAFGAVLAVRQRPVTR